VALANARQFPEALAEAWRVVKLDSTFTLGLHTLGFVQMFAGQPDSAVRTLERAAQLNPGSARASAFLVYAYAAAGRWAAPSVFERDCINPEETRLAARKPRSQTSCLAIASLPFASSRPSAAGEPG
jgi:hypothetical protein